MWHVLYIKSCRTHLTLSPALLLSIQRRHEAHPLPLAAIHAPPPNMIPEQLQNLTLPPPLRHRPIRGAEIAHRLRPLATRRLTLNHVVSVAGVGGARAALGDGRVGRGRVRRRRGLALRRPVVDVPVVLVEEQVVLVKLCGRHGGEVGGGEGGEEEVRLEGSALAGLVCSGVSKCSYEDFTLFERKKGPRRTEKARALGVVVFAYAAEGLNLELGPF